MGPREPLGATNRTNAKGEPHSWLALFARLALVGAGTLALVAWTRRRYIAYEVAGDSMLPAFHAGDYLVAERFGGHRLPRVGEVVLALDPRDPSRTLLKRVQAVDLHRQVTLWGDNFGASTDSRHFGPVPAEAVLARVRFRYWPLFR